MRGLMIGLMLGVVWWSRAGCSVPRGALAKDNEGPCYVAKAVSKYPGDLASQRELAIWMAGGAADAGIPPELPVMAALVDSGVRNLPPGDDDAAGFFQMRVGIWNTGEYLEIPTRRELQLRWFIDLAITFKAQWIAAGLSTRRAALWRMGR